MTFNLIKLISFKNVCKNLINNQKQLSRGVLQKNCSKNFRKIHRKTSSVECCDFSTKITFHRVCVPVNFQKIFRTGFLQNTSGQLLPNYVGSTKNLKNEWLAQRRLIKRIFQRRIQNPVEHVRWSLLRK